MTHSNRRGITVVEVLVLICILGVLLALLLPNVRSVRDASARTTCMNHQKQIILGLHSYHDLGCPIEYFGIRHPDYPGGGQFPTGCTGSGQVPEERLSWYVELLPYIEESEKYNQIMRDKDYESNRPATERSIRVLICPSSTIALSENSHYTSYIAMAGIGISAAEQPAKTTGNGFMGFNRWTSFNMIKDGTSNTIAIMETQWDNGPWARGGTSTVRGFDPADGLESGDRGHFGGHDKIVNVGMVDGTVRNIRTSIDPKILAAAITIAGDDPYEFD